MSKPDVHSQLSDLIESIVAPYADDDPMKVEQLYGAIATAHMVIDQLHERAATRGAEGV